MRDLILFLLRHIVVLIMLAAGLRTSWAGLRALASRPALFGRAVAVIVVLVPVIAILCAKLIPMPRVEAGLIALMAVCPGAPLVLRAGRKSGVSSSTALGVLLGINLFAPLTVALWLAALDQAWNLGLEVPIATVVRIVVGSVFVPLAAGVALRGLLPRWADTMARVLDGVTTVVFLIAVVAVIALARPALSDFIPGALIALAITTWSAAILGHLAGGPGREDRAAVSFAAVWGNPSIALAIVAQSRPGLEVVAPIAAYLLLRALLFLPYRLWFRRSKAPVERHVGGELPAPG